MKKTAATDNELSRGRWKYKQLQGSKPKAAKLRQITIGDGLRVALIVDEAEHCVMTAVLAYDKGTQNAQIERAAELARTTLEEEP